MEIGQVPAYKRWSNRYSYAFKMEVIQAFTSEFSRTVIVICCRWILTSVHTLPVIDIILNL